VNTPIKSYSVDASNNNINYNTVRECGVYMYDGGLTGRNFNIYPLPVSIPVLANYTSQSLTGSFSGNSADGAAVGTYAQISISNIDDGYLVYPNYGISTWSQVSYAGTLKLNFYNNTSNPLFVTPASLASAYSCKIYYNNRLLV
jgi:hypothetical protein